MAKHDGKQSVLVTGGAGFIGSHLARSILKSSYDVDIADNLSTGKLENVPEAAGFYELDLRFPEAIRRLPDKHYSAVLHLAGQSSGEKSFDDPLYDLDCNVRSTLLLAHWAMDKAIPAFVYASSMGVYGQVETYPVSEDTVPQPISYYGASKLGAEQVLGVAARQGLRTVCLRMFNVYGPGQNLDDMKQGMVSIFLAQILRSNSVLVKGSLQRVRDFIYIDDVVSAWKLALEKPVSGIFNLGTGIGTTVGDLITALLKSRGQSADFPVHSGGPTPGDQFAAVADTDLICKALGWQPTVSLSEGIEKIVTWARNLEKRP